MGPRVDVWSLEGLLEEIAGIFALRQGQGQILLPLVADDTDGHAAGGGGADGVTEITGVVHELIVDANNDIAGSEA